MSKVNTLNAIKTLKIGSSNLMCIKIFITSPDLIAAIKSAINKVYLPRLIPATVTVIEVKTNNDTHTNM